MPSVVLRAFAPETDYVLSVNGVMLLEACDSPFISGERTPGMRDIMLAMLVLTDEDAVIAAHRKGALDALIHDAGAGRRPAEVFAQAPKIHAAIAAAMEPVDSGADDDQKKSSPGPAGG